jgi:hypothetical protein
MLVRGRLVEVEGGDHKHLRRALFMPALVAIQWEPNVNAF